MTSELESMKNIADRLGIGISNLDLLKQALTHRSFLGEAADADSNERLEFLGDSVLGLVVSEYLYTMFPDRSEGELAKAKAVAVSEPVLADAAVDLGLPDMVLVSAGEDASGGRQRLSILSDAFEAVVAVVYLDCGLEDARSFILRALKNILTDIEKREHIRDFKTALQEYTQGIHKKAPTYIVAQESGADHDKTFVVDVVLDDTYLGRGSGKSKKQAEQAAAMEALQRVGKSPAGIAEET